MQRCIGYNPFDGGEILKIRHIVIVLLAVLAIAFMQPFITFLGGVTVLVGVATLIFRDLSATEQDAVERRVLSWLRRVRERPTAELERPSATLPHRSSAQLEEPVLSAERIRRSRNKSAPPEP